MDDIKDIVYKLMGQMTVGQPASSQKIEDLWGKILSQQELKNTRLVGIKEDQLFVNVDSPARLYTMRLKKNRLLKEIQIEFPNIKQIHFKVGKVT